MPTKGPNAVTKENLTVDHFLDKADMLVKHGDEIKHLHAQAQGEFTLREAIRTLQIWGFERDFTLMTQVSMTHTHTHTHKHTHTLLSPARSFSRRHPSELVGTRVVLLRAQALRSSAVSGWRSQ